MKIALVKRGAALLASVVFLCAPRWVSAEVKDSSATGFTATVSLTVQASPADTYRRLVHNVGDWWDSEHTFSGDSHNLSIDDKPMGCFCEKLPDQGGIRHMEVVYAAPGKTLVLAGALGPLQSLAATGSMTIRLSPAASATKLEVSYAVLGYSPAGMNTWAAVVDTVLNQQFNRLKNYLESGDPTTPKTGASAPR